MSGSGGWRSKEACYIWCVGPPDLVSEDVTQLPSHGTPAAFAGQALLASLCFRAEITARALCVLGECCPELHVYPKAIVFQPGVSQVLLIHFLMVFKTGLL